LTGAFLVFFYRKILLFALDFSMAVATGMRIGLWNGIVAVWFGLAIGLSIKASGMLYTFGCLVLPPLVAKNVCREVRSMFFVSPVIAVVTGVIAFILANHFDYPPGQMTVAFFCLELVAAWIVRRRRA
jgi:ABC-type Mn2+/Zn2+ transport system permease subunit